MKKSILLICVLCILGAAVYLLFGGFRGDGGESSPPLQTEDSQGGEGRADEQARDNPDRRGTGTGDDEIARLIAEGDALADAQSILAARNKYSEALSRIVQQNVAVENREQALEIIRSKLLPLNRIIYGEKSRIFEGQSYHRVARGEVPEKIAAKYRITARYLMKRLNGRENINMLWAGERLKVVQGPFHAVVDLGDRRLYVFHGEHYYTDFEVSIGKAGRETPVDDYVVADKLADDFSWTDPDTGEQFRPGDPEFMLGTRWIKLVGDRVGDGGIGIHGRNPAHDDRPLGEAVSRGCIRMRNRDVEELYDLLIPRHSRVIVQE